MPIYACDAGCEDPPIKLGKQMTQLPVKLTDPLTAILYITADRTHMLEMKEALHLRQVAEAPAHEQHVISLHKHGHHFGGLPMLFWASIGILIAVFHLFLFKLIFNEYCQSSEPSYIRPKYNM
ncbi:hypothetical protein LSAT2_012954 [Lamellibrachia satsuma]|nr:hypothetical protein LSAT2_012954 [Lamellibrachia satsuma]